MFYYFKHLFLKRNSACLTERTVFLCTWRYAQCRYTTCASIQMSLPAEHGSEFVLPGQAAQRKASRGHARQGKPSRCVGQARRERCPLVLNNTVYITPYSMNDDGWTMVSNHNSKRYGIGQNMCHLAHHAFCIEIYTCNKHPSSFYYSFPPVPDICQRTGSALVQMTVCRLIGTMPLSAPMLEYCLLEQTPAKFGPEYNRFHFWKCILNAVCEISAILPREEMSWEKGERESWSICANPQFKIYIIQQCIIWRHSPL